MRYIPTDEDYEWASRVGRSYARKLRVDSLKDDAAQEACIAVWRGARNYDAERGVSFRQYVIKRLRGRIKDLIRSEIGRSGQQLAMRNGFAIADGSTSYEEGRYCVQLDDGSRPILNCLIEQEQIQLLHEACLVDHEHWQLASWAGLLTQRAIGYRRGVSEAYVSLCAKQLRTELRVTFDVEELA